jgi:hypothetical protein
MAGITATAPERPIASLAHEMLQRQMVDEDKKRPYRMPLIEPQGAPEAKPIAPELAAMLGNVADAASTYSFLKAGTSTEGNAMYKGMGDKPLATSMSVLGSGLASQAVRAILRHAGQKKLADTLAGVQGGQQMGLAGNNFAHMAKQRHDSSDHDYIAEIQNEMRMRRAQER